MKKRKILLAGIILLLCMAPLDLYGDFRRNCAFAGSLSTAGGYRRIMLIHSCHKGHPWTDTVGESLVEHLRARFPRADFVTEYMDVRRNPEITTLFDHMSLLSNRYRNVDFDLVIGVGDAALQLLRSYGGYLFPDAPAVYVGVRKEQFAFPDLDGMAGVTRTFDIEGSIALVEKLLPHIRKIYVVSGEMMDLPDGVTEKKGHAELEFLGIASMSTVDWAAMVRSLHEDSALLVTEGSNYSWSEGFLSNESIDTFLSATKLPVFTTSENLVKQDRAIGGFLHRGEMLGKEGAEVAASVLEGIDIDEIRDTELLPQYVFSAPALGRAGIDPDDLPAQSVIYNRDLSFWNSKRDLVILNLGIGLFALLFAAYLIVCIRRRKLAEKRLRSEKGFMEKLFQNTPEGIILVDDTDRIVRMNSYMGEMFRVDPESCIGKPVNEIVADDEELLEDAVRLSEKVFAGSMTEHETLRRRSDGTLFPVSIKSMPFDAGGEKMVYGIYRDVTGRKKYENMLMERLRYEELISSVASRMVLGSPVSVVTGECLEKIGNFINADRAYVVLFQEESMSWRILHQWDPGQDTENQASCTFRENIFLAILPGSLKRLHSGGQVISENVQEAGVIFSEQEKASLLEQGINSLVLLPMYRDERVYGITGFLNPWKNTVWNSDNINILRTFRNVLLEALKRQELEEKLENNMSSIGSALEGTIAATGQIIEIRDPYTAGHQKRVARLAVSIADRLNLSDSQLRGVYYASLVHDIGKINIPAEILTKPGLLSSIEEELVKKHPVYGWEILKNIDFPWPVARIVLQHHEHYDGSGYPDGLKGEEIMPEARILTVADVLEAMSSDRPYRPARKLEESLTILEKYSGIYYDPDVISACFEICRDPGLFSDGACEQ